jgi:hypothetical protein
MPDPHFVDDHNFHDAATHQEFDATIIRKVDWQGFVSDLEINELHQSVSES